MSLVNMDKISTWMGAPPHHWKQSEASQIKNIHRCYRAAYLARDDVTDQVETTDMNDNQNTITVGNTRMKVTQRHHKQVGDLEDGEANEDSGETENKKDLEAFLPRDSPLRSKGGDKKAPANPTFKDYDAFLSSCQFDYWRAHFEQGSTDKFLSETARTIVANICAAQSRNQMRVHNGHVPLRKKREHITPLALVLHEIKMWAVVQLRTANVFHEDTFQDLRCRVKYLEGLAHKEVWGDAAISFGQGMRAVAHDKLFRLFLSSSEALVRAEQFAYRGYSRRSSREKLARAGDLLKEMLVEEMRILSARLTIENKLEDPKTARLQPTELLNSIENQTFVDYKNFVNVLFYKLVQNPLVRASLTGDYDKGDVKEILANISDWSHDNLFCRPASKDDPTGAPQFKMDKKRETRLMPEIYAPTAAELKSKIRAFDPKTPVPDSAKRIIARLENAYESTEAAGKVIQLVMKNAAAIQDLVPTLFAMHQLWTLAGDGGDFTVYDTMREHVIRIMQDTIQRVQSLRVSGKILLREINKLCEIKEETMKMAAIKKGKTKYKPAWVRNHRFIKIELVNKSERNYDATLARLVEIAQDARDYSLSTDQLSDKVVEAKSILDSITGFNSAEAEDAPLGTATPGANASAMKAKGSDWLGEEEDFGDFGKNNAFGDQYSSAFGGEDAGSYNPQVRDEDYDSY